MKYIKKFKKEYTCNMGAIQSSINQMLGTVAASAFAVKHTAEQEQEAAVKAAMEKPGIEEEVGQLQEQAYAEQAKAQKTEKQIEEAQKENTPESWQAAGILESELEEGGKALKILNQKIAARKIMVERLQKTINKANKWKLGGNE